MEIKDEDADRSGSWRRYACLRQFLVGEPESKWDEICRSTKLNNLRILAQVSLWRLHQTCNKPNIHKKEWMGCEALDPWNGIPFISENYKGKHKFLRPEQTTGDYMIEMLSAMKYDFDKDEFHNDNPVDEQLRFKLQTLIDKLADRQKGDERIAEIRAISSIPASRVFPLEIQCWPLWGHLL